MDDLGGTPIFYIYPEITIKSHENPINHIFSMIQDGAPLAIVIYSYIYHKP